jgi:hypothetical protein
MGKVHKGWVNSKTGKMNMWQSNSPYHIGHVASNPQKYGYTRDELIDVLKNSKITVFIGSISDYFASLVDGSRDVSLDIENHMFDDGWIRITMEETTWKGMGLADIMGRNLREIHKGLKIMERKGYVLDVLLGNAIITLWTGQQRANLKPELRIQDTLSWREFMKTGRPPKEDRTEIGRTMARFREWLDRQSKEKELKEKTYAKSGIGAWMNQQSAGGGPGWDRYGTTGTKLGKCGDAEEGEPYSACLSRQKAEKLGKKGIASFVRRKRDAQKKAGRGDIGDGEKGKKPVYVDTGIKDVDEATKNEPTNPTLWKKATDLAKQKFDVYPSVYANAWASKWYKEQGGTWRRASDD